MSQKIAIKLGLKQILFICIVSIICIATLGLGLGLGFGTGSRNETPAEALQEAENRMLPRGVTQVAAGNAHTMAIDSQGNLWTFGSNYYGRLGNMSTIESSAPINITAQAGNPLNGKQIVQASAGSAHTAAIDSQANLWVWGYNYNGQLGNMSTIESSAPINITAQASNPLLNKQFIQVSACANHTMAIDSQGNLWAWGYNLSGQLGNMTTTPSTNSTPINITAQAGNPLNGKQIVQVSAGDNSSGAHTMAIDSQGNLWAWGNGGNGKLGNMSTANSITPINITAQVGNPLNGKQIIQVSATSFNHTMAIDSQGNLWAFGRNSSYGQLGNMSTTDSSTPINITAQAGNPLNGRRMVQISTGDYHTMAIDASGNLWSFGDGSGGQLGNMSVIQTNHTPINITAQDGNPLNGKQIVRVSAGGYHTMAIDSQGNLWAFGIGNSGQLGNMSTITNNSTPINITVQPGNPLNQSQFGRMQVSAGATHTMAIDSTGNLWAFGENSSGQLGNMSTENSSIPINITAQPGNPLYGKQIVQVSADFAHTMAIDASGNLWAFGNNYYGQLGNMTTSGNNANSTPINLSAPHNATTNPSGVNNPLLNKQFVQVSAGAYQTMAIDSTGNLWAFGDNYFGQLGNLSTTSSSTPINITAQPGNPLNGEQIIQVSSGDSHTLAIDSLGLLWAFGNNYYGQLGNMTTSGNNANSTPINLSAPHNASNPSGLGNPLLNKQFIQVSAGGFHTVVIDSSGLLWAFGNGSNGQLGNLSTTNSSTPINLTARSENPLNGKQILQISAGYFYTMAIDSQGNLWAFGSGGNGQLGNMSTTSTNSTPINLTAQSENPLNGKQIVQVSIGDFHTMAIDSQGNLWAFGGGGSGQLGNMSTTSTNSTPINISTIVGTSASIFGNPAARISVRTNFTIGWGTANASGGTFKNWTADTLSSPAITKNNDTQAGRVRYEFDAGNCNTISELSIDGVLVGISTFSNLALYNNTFYLRIITADTRLIVEIDRINTKLFVPITISAITTRNVGHIFNFSDTSHLSSRMKITSGAETISLTHIFDNLTWDNGKATTTFTIFTFTSQAAFTRIIISRSTLSDITITDFTNPIISVAGLTGTLIYNTGTTNTLTITLIGMEQYEYAWTIETISMIQVQQILNPPAGAISVANPALLTLNSSSGANWADSALESPGNLFGKTFAGWYTHPDYTKGTQITTATQLQQHITATGGAIVFLYARWV